MKHNDTFYFVPLGHSRQSFQNQLHLSHIPYVSAPSFSYYLGTTPCSKRMLQLLVPGNLPSKELGSFSTLFYSLFKCLTSLFNSACVFQLHSSEAAEHRGRKSVNALALRYHLLNYDCL